MKIIKYTGFLFLFLISSLSFSQTNSFKKSKTDSPDLTLIWETEAVLDVPESVLYDAKDQRLFVSNINGSPTEKNGKGYISLLSEEGKIINKYWLKGLDAPKGMGILGNNLYVTNITEVVKIDLKTAEIIKRIPVEGAEFLNDISIGPDDCVYVSDMKKNRIHTIKNDKPEIYMENISSANGLYATENALFVLSGDRLLKIKPDQSIETIASGIQGGGDGIEMVNEKAFLASGWQGVIHFIDQNGKVWVLLDSRSEESNTADIGFNKEKQIVYIPTFFKNKVVAYQLNMKQI